VIDPTGDEEEYPLFGLPGCLQTQVDDGTRTHDVEVVLLVVEGTH
jgi:hypothetical protein